MQSSNFLNLQAAAMALSSYNQMDLGFFSDSAVSSPESQPPPPYSATASPAHSLAESIDSAFHELDDCFDASFYNDSPTLSQDKLKPDLQSNNNSFVDSSSTNLDFDWMSMPLIDFKITEEQHQSSNTTQNIFNKPTSINSPEIDFRNLEIVLKEKAKEKMLEQQQMKCKQDELKFLQNIMLYKQQQQQQQQQNVMFTEPLNLPSQNQQSNNQLSSTISVIDDPLPDDFLANNCANLIEFINTGNPDAKFPTNVPLTPPYHSSFNFQQVKNEFQNTCQNQLPQPVQSQRPPTKVTIIKPKQAVPHIPKHTSKPRLFNFLVELLQNPDQYGNCIEWKDKETGVFKFMDSAEVARLWGHRKNKPHMKYENFARSLRTYIAKGILTKPRNKLVYKFVKTVI